ncbi:MAG TPA: tetratricopeptide repeat protein, partial [Tepidisphaeraceae bacterium]
MPNLESAIELRRAGNLAEAEARCRESLAAEPSNAAALALLGMLLGEAGRHCDAAAVLERSVVLRPDQPQAWYNLGVARERGGDLTAAARAYRRAVGLAPRFAEAHRRLGSVLYKAGRNAQAAECLRAAVQLRPDFSDAWGALAKACGELGWQAEATACRRRVVELRPDSAAEHSRLLYDLHYDPAISPEEMFEEHLHWARRHADPLSASGGGEAPTRLSSSKSAGPRFASEPRLGRSLALPFAPRGDCPVGRRLRVGYVSADFRAHPVARFQEPVLANHDHDAFEVFCYSDA